MRITEARLIPYRLPLARPWRTAAVTLTERRGWLVRLAADDGRVGWGDCAPLPEAGTETLEAAEARLEPWLRALHGREVAELLDFLAGRGFDRPAARCALETALGDLAAQAANLPLAHWLNPQAADAVAVNGLLAEGEEAPTGFAVLKLKVGLIAPDQESALVRRLAGRLPPGAKLRVDANRAWSEAEAARFIADIADLPIDCLEEPLAAPEPAALARLQAAAPFALALDESLPGFTPPLPVRRAVIKAPPLGGPRIAFEHGRRLLAAGHEVVVTSCLDSACGRLAALHLACAVDRGLAHGLATGAWLAADTGAAPAPAAGRMALPQRPGLGFVAA